jgi:hypothetical protein
MSSNTTTNQPNSTSSQAAPLAEDRPYQLSMIPLEPHISRMAAPLASARDKLRAKVDLGREWRLMVLAAEKNFKRNLSMSDLPTILWRLPSFFLE